MHDGVWNSFACRLAQASMSYEHPPDTSGSDPESSDDGFRRCGSGRGPGSQESQEPCGSQETQAHYRFEPLASPESQEPQGSPESQEPQGSQEPKVHYRFEPPTSPESQEPQVSQESRAPPPQHPHQPDEPSHVGVQTSQSHHTLKRRRCMDLNLANAAVGSGRQKRVKLTQYAINGKCRKRIARCLQEGVCSQSRKCSRKCSSQFTVDEVGKVCDTCPTRISPHLSLTSLPSFTGK